MPLEDRGNDTIRSFSAPSLFIYSVVFGLLFAIVVHVYIIPHLHQRIRREPMKLDEVKKIAKERGLQTKGMKKKEIIRLIQQDEGNNDCYETGNAASCGQTECLWRDDCH